MAKLCVIACFIVLSACIHLSNTHKMRRSGRLPVYWIPKTYVDRYTITEDTPMPIVCGTAMISYTCEHPALADGDYGLHIVPIFRRTFVCKLRVGLRDMIPCM